ncbi:MAG: hypothetical protein K2I68_08125, partial [Bacteroidales bacterium]|nr:hypothetical protein [Bacteroidales bacterium]
MKPLNLKQIIGIISNLIALVFLGCGAPLNAQSITHTYLPSRTSDYNCVGDTILVTATADNIADLIVPEGTHWSGDAGDAVVSQTANSITKRFFTYHPYLETNPTANSSHNFDFTIRLKDGTTKTVTQAITAKSCPPKLTPDKLSLSPQSSMAIDGKYNLGIIIFNFSFSNVTSDTGKGHIRFMPDFSPAQRFTCVLSQRSGENQFQIRYAAIPTSDATYAITVFYNEGDSLNRKIEFNKGKVNLQEPLDTLKPDNTTYCPGNDIVFSLELGSTWQNVINQTIDNDASKTIDSCFKWNGSPAPVSFTHKDGNKYFFATQAAGTSTADYHCTMSVVIKYKSAKTGARVDTSFIATYDVPIEEVQFAQAKGFKQSEYSACQNTVVPLIELTESGVTATYWHEDRSSIPQPNNYIPFKSEVVSAVITAPCPWTDKLKVNVIDQGLIESFSVQHDTLICAGEAVSFSATANAPITWNIMHDENSDLNESLEDIESGTVLTRTFPDNATVQAIVSKCGHTDQIIRHVQVVQRPQVTMDAEKRDCPYTHIDFGGTCTGCTNSEYRLYDLRNKTDLTGTYLTNPGLQGYPLRPNDSLR